MLIFIFVMTCVVRTRRRLLVLAVPDRPERDLTPVGPPVPRTSLASSFEPVPDVAGAYTRVSLYGRLSARATAVGSARPIVCDVHGPRQNVP